MFFNRMVIFPVVLLAATSGYSLDLKQVRQADVPRVCSLVLEQIGAGKTLEQAETATDISAEKMRSVGATLQSRLKDDMTQLAGPDNLRNEKDPRWFRWIRSTSKNPVTLRLQASIKITQEKQNLLKDIQSTLTATGNLEALVNGLGTSVAPYDLAVYHWLLGNIRTSVKQSMNTIDAYEGTVSEEDSGSPFKPSIMTSVLSNDRGQIDALQKFLSDHPESHVNPLMKEFRSFAENDLLKKATATVEEILGVSVTEASMRDLLNYSLNKNIPMNELGTRLKEVDSEMKDRFPGQFMGDGIPARLTLFSLNHGVNAKEIVQRYFEIKKLGRGPYGSPALQGPEAALLTDVSLANHITSDQLMEEFFKIRNLASKVGKFFKFSEPSAAILTSLAFRYKTTPPEQIVDNFNEIYKAELMTRKGASINDLSVALLVEPTLNGMNARQISADLHAIEVEMIKRKLNFRAEDLSRLTLFALSFNLDAADLAELVHRASLLAGSKAGLNRILSGLAVAIKSKSGPLSKGQANSNITDADLATLIKIPGVLFVSANDGLNLPDGQRHSGNWSGDSDRPEFGDLDYYMTTGGFELGFSVDGKVGVGLDGSPGIRFSDFP